MVRFFPSNADEFRDRVLEQERHNEAEETSLELDPEDRRLELYAQIEKLGEAATRSQNADAAEPQQLTRLTEMHEAITASPSLSYPMLAIEEISKLERLFEEGQALCPSEKERKALEEGWAGNATLKFEPYHPGGDWTRVWMNFWRYGLEQAPSVGMRLFWETYGANQNFTVFEDFDGNSAMGSKGVLKAVAPKAINENKTLNITDTAINAFIKHLNEVAPNTQFKWVGDLLMLANIWIVPAEAAITAATGDKQCAKRVTELLRRHFLREPLAEQPEHLQELRDTLQRLSELYFANNDETRLGRVDPNCAMARVADGRGFVMTDSVHRQLADDAAASRRIIVFDIAMTPEERGRVAKCICDMWTYQTIAQRDYPYAVSISNALNSIENALNELAADYGKASDQHLVRIENGAETADLAKTFDQLRNRLDRITAVLSATNYFLKDGVRGTADNARTMANLQTRRVTEMQVRQFSSFRGLDAIISPFESTVNVMEGVSARYQRCEHRLTELANLVSGHHHRLHIDSMEKSSEASRKLGEDAVHAAKENVAAAKDNVKAANRNVMIAAAAVVIAVLGLVFSVYRTGDQNASASEAVQPAPSNAETALSESQSNSTEADHQ